MPMARPAKVSIIHIAIATSIRPTNVRRVATAWPRRSNRVMLGTRNATHFLRRLRICDTRPQRHSRDGELLITLAGRGWSRHPAVMQTRAKGFSTPLSEKTKVRSIPAAAACGFRRCLTDTAQNGSSDQDADAERDTDGQQRPVFDF